VKTEQRGTKRGPDVPSEALFRPIKKSITVRLDADVLAWLKSKGPGYQSRINAILRAVMLAELKR
jgi:uncharacterized protein (DUF4415 family)